MNKENTMKEDIAVIKNELVNLTKNFEEFKNDNKRFCDNTTGRVNDIENKAISISERVSNLTVFQTAFSLIIGAIATYLGINKQ